MLSRTNIYWLYPTMKPLPPVITQIPLIKCSSPLTSSCHPITTTYQLSLTLVLNPLSVESTPLPATDYHLFWIHHHVALSLYLSLKFHAIENHQLFPVVKPLLPLPLPLTKTYYHLQRSLCCHSISFFTNL